MVGSGSRPSFLHRPSLELLLFGGKGGVGKTTCATAAALELSRNFPQKRFLLISTDPAHSLADAMSASLAPRNLSLVEFDAVECLARFKTEHQEKIGRIAGRGTFLDDDDLREVLDLSLPGLDEWMAFWEISRLGAEGRFDCTVVDTAPTGHTLRLLGMPDGMRRWIRALDSMLGKHRYLRRVLGGIDQPDDLDHFLEGLGARVEAMERLLRDPARCLFVPVMLAEPLSIEETWSLLEELEAFRVPVADVIVNKLYPESGCAACQEVRARQLGELGGIRRRTGWSKYCWLGIPMHPEEVRGSGPLATFWSGVSELRLGGPAQPLPCGPSGHPGSVPGPLKSGARKQAVQRPIFSRLLTGGEQAAVALPAGELRLLILAGKGGAGKTTLACVTAVRLAEDLPGKEILLVSVDPAHSVSDCLGVPVGEAPARICGGLSAIEIDARAEFERLKELYRSELDEFFATVLDRLDVPFEREVLERILDLSPPGLDEIMALTHVTKVLHDGHYDVLVLDSAPTGHLIRLLELPELIERWLQVTFGLFLKYRHVFRAPAVTGRLVEMSKSLKKLRSLLRDAHRTALYIVSTLAEMSLEETRDLAAACRRLGIAAPVLFLNLATPRQDCRLCAALYQGESLLRDKFRQLFPEMRQAVVYQQGDLRGLENLRAFGESLYAPAAREALTYVS